MSIYEFDEEREMRLIREDEREIGREEGIEIGRVSGIEIGKASGIEIGKASGIEEGKQKILLLNKMLLDANRIDDLKRATNDGAYLEELCREYSIT